ncbi:MAG: Flp pilus assembly protein TadB [Saprospiraceae bacterium]|jgi:Flp pilus assembly protein TadB
MKTIYYTLISCVMLMLCSSVAFAVVPVQKAENQEQVSKETAKKAFHELSQKKQKKLKKRLAKLKNKLEEKAGPNSGIFDEARFRLGAVVFLAGLAVLILAGLFIGFGGIITWVANVAVLIGIILMVWSAIEYFG